jgi:dihydroflavonol-4-reductase
MLTVVTGAYGLVGANLVRLLLEGGHQVRAADIRTGPALDGLDVEHAHIDVMDPDSLRAAFEGAEQVFHLAAVISIVGDPTGMVRRVNVEGARNTAEAALSAGVGRYLHCSSVHAFDLEHCGPSLDEHGPRALGDHAPPYDRSKNKGEEEVRAVIEKGLDARIVNPTGVMGPDDYEPSRTGETLMQLRDGKIPVNVGGAFDFVDVRDVAAGMVGAIENGRTGENYLLSGNRISIKELGRLVADITGGKPPRIGVPVRLLAPLAPLVMRLTPADNIPLITSDSLHALQYSPLVSHYKAAKEFGYTARPIHETVKDTLDWFEDRA